MKDLIIKYWVDAGLGVVFAALTTAYRNFSIKQRSLRQGTKSLLRNQIIQSYDKYMHQKWIPIYGMENVDDMYEAYHALGGNGTITKLVDELRSLSSNPPDNVN